MKEMSPPVEKKSKEHMKWCDILRFYTCFGATDCQKNVCLMGNLFWFRRRWSNMTTFSTWRRQKRHRDNHNMQIVISFKSDERMHNMYSCAYVLDSGYKHLKIVRHYPVCVWSTQNKHLEHDNSNSQNVYATTMLLKWTASSFMAMQWQSLWLIFGVALRAANKTLHVF